MDFKIINKDDWDRREYFEHYFSEIPCTYSMTVKLILAKLKFQIRNYIQQCFTTLQK